MNHVLKRLLPLALSAALSIQSVQFTYAQAQAPANNVNLSGIRLEINGETLTDLPMEPVIYDGYTLVPAREVFEKLGAVVDWKPDTREIYVGYSKRLLVMQVDNKFANVDGTFMPMAVPPKIINNKTMIPLRFVSECFGFTVDWNPTARVASISQWADTPPTMDDVPTTPPPYIPVPDLPVMPTPGVPPSPTPMPVPTPMPQIPVATPAPTVTPMPTPSPAVGAAAKDKSTGAISAIDAPETRITKIVLPGNNQNNFVIQASSAISRVEKSLLPDNRLVLDIHKAHMQLDQTEYVVEHSGVKRIRTAQNQTEPEKVTRVVFDLADGAEFEVSLSADRTQLLVKFARNKLTNVVFTTQGAEDVVTLTFNEPPTANVYPLIDPDRVVIDVPNTDLGQAFNQGQFGRFTTAIRTNQLSNGTAQVVLDLKGSAMFEKIVSGNVVTIRLKEPTYRNIRYDGKTKTLTIQKSGAGALNSQGWQAIDRYNDLTYTLVLPGDYTNLLGYGEYVLNDASMQSVLIQKNAQGKTELVLREKAVFAYNVEDKGQTITITAVAPKDKYERVVILDPGHGGKDPGTSGNGLVEKDVNFDVAKRAAQLLEQDGKTKVYMTRTSDVYITLEDRVAFANPLGDLFVSIHCNAADKNPKANGTETYYFTHSNDGTIGISSKEVASTLQRSMLKHLQSTDRKAMESGFYVIKFTKIPSALIELGFLSNPEEAARMATDSYRQQAAQGISEGINTIFQTYHPS